MIKNWYQSKTLISNAVIAFGGLAAVLPNLDGVINSSVFGWTMFVVGLANIGLRIITTQGVTK